MRIFLMQHGESVPKEQDADRPLSYRGRKDAAKVADFLHRAGVVIDQSFHSGKTRARETAEIVTPKLNPGLTPLFKKGLLPLDDVGPVAAEIGSSNKDTLIAGHLPHIGKLASLLVTGNEDAMILRFQQGGVACLVRDEQNRWTVNWMVVPELL